MLLTNEMIDALIGDKPSTGRASAGGKVFTADGWVKRKVTGAVVGEYIGKAGTRRTYVPGDDAVIAYK